MKQVTVKALGQRIMDATSIKFVYPETLINASPELWGRVDKFCNLAELDRGAPNDRITSASLIGDLEAGRINMAFVVYDGADMRFADATGADFALKEGDVIGYNVFKFTKAFGSETLRAALAARRAGKTPAEIYESLSGTIPERWSKLMIDDSAAGAGSAGFLVEIQALPQLRGCGISKKNIGAVMQHLWGLHNDHKFMEYAVAYARLPQMYDRYGEPMTGEQQLQNYVAEQAANYERLQRHKPGEAGKPHVDWGVLIHMNAGGELVCGLPHCSPRDLESLFNGALIVYDLKRLFGPKK